MKTCHTTFDVNDAGCYWFFEHKFKYMEVLYKLLYKEFHWKIVSEQLNNLNLSLFLKKDTKLMSHICVAVPVSPSASAHTASSLVPTHQLDA